MLPSANTFAAACGQLGIEKGREGDKAKDTQSGLSIRGASGGGGSGSDFGPIPRREDDRATKRRK